MAAQAYRDKNSEHQMSLLQHMVGFLCARFFKNYVCARATCSAIALKLPAIG